MASSFPKSLLLSLALFIAISSSAHAFTLEVGGTNGWTLKPTETYTAWAHRLRFSVNDTLHFKYNAATDSVLVVSNDDYNNCNSNNPITKLDGAGDSSFTFDRSGPFFFITGNKTNCDQGQKIHIVVLAIRNNNNGLPNSAHAVSPSGAASAPTAAGGSPAPGAAASAPGTTGSNPSDHVSAPAPAQTQAKSSARAAFNADSTVPFVMMLSLAFAWMLC